MIDPADLTALFWQAYNEGWGYIWGGAGQTWTEAKQKAATRPMTVKYGSKWIGKRVADCSGLFVWAFKALGESIYHGSNTIWKKYCSNQGKITTDTELKAGTAVFLLKGSNRHHIGLYVGGGTVVEAKGTAYGVVTSKLSHWDEWGELKQVSYSDGKGDAENMTIRKGSKGDLVVTLQKKLIEFGNDIEADGIFGEKTENALKLFQTSKGLTADGICGPATWAAFGIDADTQETGEKSASDGAETVTIEIPKATAETLLEVLKSALKV